MSQQANIWPDPLPLPHGLLPVEQLEENMLPLSVGPWIFDIAERMQCPADFVAVGALAALGSVVGAKAVIRPEKHTDWIEAPNLWGMIIGRPGAMKSPALAEALRPLKKLQTSKNKKYSDAMKKYEVEQTTHQRKQKALEKALDEAIKDGLPTEGIEKKLFALEAPARPRRRQYEVNDCTYEALGEIMVQNPNGTLLHRDELVSLLIDLGREEKASARGFFLQAWNGLSSYVFDRIGRGRVEIQNLCLSVVGSTQPTKAAPFFYEANNGGAGDDGLIQRFGLLVWPDHNKPWVPSDKGANLKALERAQEAFEELDVLGQNNLERGQYSVTSNQRIVLGFDQEALDGFLQWRTSLESDLRSEVYPPALESHFSKYRKLVPTLALLFYLADGGRVAVNIDALERAIRFSDYLKSHAWRAYSSGTATIKDAASRILARIHKKDLKDNFTARAIYSKGWSGLNDVKLVGAALELLCEFGYLREAPINLRQAGRPTALYKIHPKLM